MKIKYALVPLLALIVGCSSTPKTVTDVPTTKNDQPDYVVRERSLSPSPLWTNDFAKFKRENDGKGITYFLGESGDVSDRLAGCDLSDLDAKKKIAQQIATLITDKIASTKAGQLVIDKDNPQSPELKKYFEDTVAGKSMAFLSGVKQYAQYWEERDFSASGGKKRVYECSTVVVIADDDMKAALRKTANKTEQAVDTDAKADVKDALKDLDSQFRAYASTPQSN